MNAADTALANGFTALLATAGDTVTFRGASVPAVINWVPFDEKAFPNNPDFDRESTSRVEFVDGAVSPDPKVGEVITQGTKYHRIQSVRYNGLAWLMDCEVTT
jgi:hypothetical protein